MDKAVLLSPFWTAVASSAPADTQLALAGTSRAARDAAVQCAPKATLTLQLSPPPTPDTLAELRNSGRTLPTTIIINNNHDGDHTTPATANHVARSILPHLSCPAVTSLQLGGGTWLVDTALLTDICAGLPGLCKLVLSNTALPVHFKGDATPSLAWPSLRSVSATIDVSMPLGVQPTPNTRNDVHRGIRCMLAALGIEAAGGSGVINLRLNIMQWGYEVQVDGYMLCTMLRGNDMQALRKLDLPGTAIKAWGEGGAGGALIRCAPALEHLKLSLMGWVAGDVGTSAMCVPWRIVEVKGLDLDSIGGLPLGAPPGTTQPLILRVTHCLRCSTNGGYAGAGHLVLTAPGKRQVQLECTREAYRTIHITGNIIRPILRMLTLTTTGLSNLILDGIDSADDIKDLVDLSSTGLTISVASGAALTTDELRGLWDLLQVTRIELAVSNGPVWWSGADKCLLVSLPAHITGVRLLGGPSLELVSRMCVEVSRLPHRQAHPLRLCVPGVVGWLDAAVRAIQAAGITSPGVVQVSGQESGL